MLYLKFKKKRVFVSKFLSKFKVCMVVKYIDKVMHEYNTVTFVHVQLQSKTHCLPWQNNISFLVGLFCT